MWNERFLFVLSVLFTIGMWISFGLKRNAQRSRKSRKFANYLAYAIATASVLIIAVHFVYYLSSDWKFTSLSFPGIGSILAIMLGGIVGSFSAKFVWSFFGARFGTRDPMIGALVMLILIVVYSLPIYQRELANVLGRVGLSSLKTPFVELSFIENPKFRGATFSASRPSAGDEHPSAIPRPSYPRPGLERLKQVVSNGKWDDLAKDDRYITFFHGYDPRNQDDPELDNRILQGTKRFLTPAKALAGCLLGYVDIFPDSQLLLVDIKPIIQWFFRLHANAVKALSDKSINSADPQGDAEEFRMNVNIVRKAILTALGLSEPFNDADLRSKLNNLGSLAKWSGADETATEERGKEVDEFVELCGEHSPAGNGRTEKIESLNYLQPYITIVLANLLVAHGSPDEAVDVLAQWLDLWRCARPQSRAGKTHSRPCKIGPAPQAADLPEWFIIRAEFELNVLLYRTAGEQNITYRDFLKEHAGHFVEFAAASPPSITIRGALEQCLDKDRKPVAAPLSKNEPPEPDYRAITLRSLLQNEETLLRSEINFLAGTSPNWADLENFHERAKLLTRFPLRCIYPEGKPYQGLWEAQMSSYQITYGLVALAVAQRLAVDAGSSDERYRAEEIQKDGVRQLRDGYRDLKPHRDEDRRKFEASFWSERVFSLSAWEETCTLAERALDQLNKAGQ